MISKKKRWILSHTNGGDLIKVEEALAKKVQVYKEDGKQSRPQCDDGIKETQDQEMTAGERSRMMPKAEMDTGTVQGPHDRSLTSW